ncbi:putative efflux pump antibiotic resistance protein [Xylaria bambusicola]|uniref:putative efflux pump antibiotic resistance protein n=1 Tax=Xylaria bambusicola TaxID=326684 RepID=UPI0020073664|nr:putative efflux pump antibiotic resistance protein [Xylaria bambusicola]KAI0509536.1 putative efflux pump antibiotic resistance protein [Xylaria bambusicola]
MQAGLGVIHTYTYRYLPPHKSRAAYRESDKRPEVVAYVKNDNHAGDIVNDEKSAYLHGARFWMVSILNGVMLFLVQTEISIVTTSLVAIAEDLGRLDISSWILSSYLLGYGLGGGGNYALSTIMIVEMVPPHKYGTQVAYTGIAIILATVLGPIIGGAISSNTSWRYIFIFNVPVGAVGFALAWAGIPNGFPRQHYSAKLPKLNEVMSRLDFPGSGLLLLATTSFTASFQEAGSQFSWDSAYVITLLVASVILWLSLLLWERHVTIGTKPREPVLPWRFVRSRTMGGILIGVVLLGGPLTVPTFQLPQRFQLINGLSPLDAGVRLIPFGGAVPLGTIASVQIAGKMRVPAIFLLMAGALFQVVGFALLGTLNPSAQVPASVYGYQVIAGVGCGICFQMLFLAIPFTAEKRDQAVGLGLATQSRAMGSAIFVAIVTAVFNGYVMYQLAQVGVGDLDSISGLGSQGHQPLEASLQDAVRRILSEGYNRQMLVLSASGAAQFLTAFLLWHKNQIRVA